MANQHCWFPKHCIKSCSAHQLPQMKPNFKSSPWWLASSQQMKPGSNKRNFKFTSKVSSSMLSFSAVSCSLNQLFHNKESRCDIMTERLVHKCELHLCFLPDQHKSLSCTNLRDLWCHAGSTHNIASHASAPPVQHTSANGDLQKAFIYPLQLCLHSLWNIKPWLYNICMNSRVRCKG